VLLTDPQHKNLACYEKYQVALLWILRHDQQTEIRNARRRLDDKMKVGLKSGVRMWTELLLTQSRILSLENLDQLNDYQFLKKDSAP
jgi:hypothetical protein